MINAVIPQLTSLHLSGNLLTLALFLFGLSGTAGWTQSVQTSQPVSLHGAGSTFRGAVLSETDRGVRVCAP